MSHVKQENAVAARLINTTMEAHAADMRLLKDQEMHENQKLLPLMLRLSHLHGILWQHIIVFHFVKGNISHLRLTYLNVQVTGHTYRLTLTFVAIPSRR